MHHSAAKAVDVLDDTQAQQSWWGEKINKKPYGSKDENEFTLQTSSLVLIVLEAKGRNCGQTLGQEVPWVEAQEEQVCGGQRVNFLQV